MSRKNKMITSIAAPLILQALIVPVYASGNNNPARAFKSPRRAKNVP